MRIGYARVSTREQNPNGQADVLQANGCERLFVEHASGKHKSRPELDRALAELRKAQVPPRTRPGASRAAGRRHARGH
jgi:DNA invertase Pin-like site-specific DNA recombinase